MHLIKTQEGSQFYRFSEGSNVADQCLTYKRPRIGDREIDILQIAYVQDVKYNIIIEFIYKDKQ